MALLHDGVISTVEDLRSYESDIQETALAEGLDVESKIRLAQVEIEAQLTASGQRPGNFFLADGMSSHETATSRSTVRFDASQVVVTPPLKMWHTFQALSLFYRDANSRRASDRATAKWIEYKELGKWSADLLFQTGVGLVFSPVSRPTGIELSFSQSSIDSLSLMARASWVAGEREGAASSSRAVTTPTDHALSVEMPEPPPTATGWNVYVGTTGSELRLQNSTPIPLDTAWTMPPTGLTDGRPVGDGQSPDAYRTIPRFVWRG